MQKVANFVGVVIFGSLVFLTVGITTLLGMCMESSRPGSKSWGASVSKNMSNSNAAFVLMFIVFLMAMMLLVAVTL
jgi:hypothetical protein